MIATNKRTEQKPTPYSIQFDYGRERPFWGPEDCIRPSSISAKAVTDNSLRFKVGDRVECSHDDDWLPGIVIRTRYREESFEDDHAVPYQVQLDNGELIYAPIDSDDCIKRSSVPEISLRFEVGDRVDCLVEEGWTAGIVTNIKYGQDEFEDGNIVPYQIKLFDNGDIVYAPADSDVFVRRPLRFKVGDRVDCLVDEEWTTGSVTETWYFDEEDGHVPYQVRLNTDELVYCTEDNEDCITKYIDSRVCRGEHNGFVRIMSKLMIHNENYDGAEGMLLERVTFIKQKIVESINNEDDASNKNAIHILRADLSSFLCSLSELHQAKGDLEEMKAALEEALELIEMSRDQSQSVRKLHVLGKLASHATLAGDKKAALQYFEEAIVLSKNVTLHDSFSLGVMLSKCGKLNVECNSRERGLEQMSEGVAILTRVCGSDDMRVKLAKNDLLKMCERKTDGVLIQHGCGVIAGSYLEAVGAKPLQL